MPTDPRVDAYIEAQRPFARPILVHLRALVHDVVPHAAEGMKWRRPFYTVEGRPFCYFAGFTAHAAFGFWQGPEPTGREGEALGSLGRLTSPADLPDEATLRAMLADAARRAAGPRMKRVARPMPAMPADLAQALARSPGAGARFAALAPTYRREHIEWIEGAKRAETRMRRITRVVARLSVDPACAALQNN